jgi:archaemetzincin
VRAVTVTPIGAVPEELTRELCAFLASTLGLETQVDAKGLDPAFAKNRERGQVNARDLLPHLEQRAAELEALVLGVTEEDLYSPVFTFVFGEARLGGRAALFSLNRLRPERYGLPADPPLLIARARREALHETAHLLGLAHCKSPDCVMRFSGSAEEIDLKTDAFCAVCREQILGSRTRAL